MSYPKLADCIGALLFKAEEPVLQSFLMLNRLLQATKTGGGTWRIPHLDAYGDWLERDIIEIEWHISPTHHFIFEVNAAGRKDEPHLMWSLYTSEEERLAKGTTWDITMLDNAWRYGASRHTGSDLSGLARRENG